MCPKDGSSLDLDPDPMDLMDLDLDLDPIHPSLTLYWREVLSTGHSSIGISVWSLLIQVAVWCQRRVV